jgi:hypothetical protein
VLVEISIRDFASRTPYRGMTRASFIYEPTRAGAPFIVAIFDPAGRIVASQGFPTRPGVEAFLQAFMQEDAGEFELPTHYSGDLARRPGDSN